MAKVNVPRTGKLVYGTFALTIFKVKFPSPSVSNLTNGLYFNGTPLPFGNVVNAPTAGTLTIAGVTVTLGEINILTPAAVAAKIAATSISGYTVVSANNTIYMTDTTVGPRTKPTLVLGTATNIIYDNVEYINGITISIGAQDDVYVNSKSPITVKTTFTGGTTPDIQVSYGTLQEQALGTLTYETALSLTGGVATVSTPISFIRLTTKASNTTAALYISK